MLDIRITAETAADFYAQMRDLVMQGDVYFTPWEQVSPIKPTPAETPIKEMPEEPKPEPEKKTTKKAAAKKAKKADPEPAAEAEKKTEPAPQVTPAAEPEKKTEPAPQVTPAAEPVDKDAYFAELRKAAIDIDRVYGKPTFNREIKTPMGFEAMGDLSLEDMKKVMQAIEDFKAAHPKE